MTVVYKLPADPCKQGLDYLLITNIHLLLSVSSHRVSIFTLG